jgi:hypothetical protein
MLPQYFIIHISPPEQAVPGFINGGQHIAALY